MRGQQPLSPDPWLRIILGAEGLDSAAVLRSYAGERPQTDPEDLGGVLCQFAPHLHEDKRVAWLTAGPRHGPRASVNHLVELFRAENRRHWLILVIEQFDAALAAWGEKATEHFLIDLPHYGIRSIIKIDSGAQLVPIGAALHPFGHLTLIDDTGEEVASDFALPIIAEPPNALARRIAAEYQQALPPPGPPRAKAPEGPPLEKPRARATPRYVNLVVADTHLQPLAGPLDEDQYFLLRVNIGPLTKNSIVVDAVEHPFPDKHLPPTPTSWWLDVVIEGPGIGSSAEIGRRWRQFFLPFSGTSWSCGCAPGGLHYCGDRSRQPWLDFLLKTPPSAGPMTFQVRLYLGAALLQDLQVTVPVAVEDPPRSTATVTFTLDTDLTTFARFADRALSIALNGAADGQNWLSIKDATGRSVSFDLNDHRAGAAADSLRSLLFDAQLLVQPNGQLASRYDTDYRKSDQEYVQDMRRLAEAGLEVYAALRLDPTDDERLADWLADESRLTGAPPVIQIVKAPTSRLPVPWQLIYELPGEGDPARWQECPSIWEYGPHRVSATASVPARCPHESQHDDQRGTLCPFGFWGFTHVLEVPPSNPHRSLAAITGKDTPPDLVVAYNPTLAGAAWDAHVANLANIVHQPGLFTVAQAGTWRQTIAPGVDVLYFYCHGRRLARPGSQSPRPALELGPDWQITPQDVTNWTRLRPRVRWQKRRPLVVLNACYTGEVLPDTLTDFVTAFVAATGAAGVIATEIAMEARLASRAMEIFLTELWAGRSVGKALRAMRWRLLASGNLMGLAYTPYCDANLRIPRTA